jgi:CheY-like chemotaxis protein
VDRACENNPRHVVVVWGWICSVAFCGRPTALSTSGLGTEEIEPNSSRPRGVFFLFWAISNKPVANRLLYWIVNYKVVSARWLRRRPAVWGRMSMIPRKSQILLVEDDEDDAFLLQRLFQKYGFSQLPHICPDGLDAIEYLQGDGPYADRARFPFPRVLLTDLKMPRVNGFEFLRWLRENPKFSVIPTVVMSSSSDPGDVKYAYCLGANAFICKPGSASEFEKSITTLLHFWERCEIPALDAESCDQLARKHGQASV